MKPYDRRLFIYRVALTALVGTVLILTVAYQQKQRELDQIRERAQKWEVTARALDRLVQNKIMIQKIEQEDANFPTGFHCLGILQFDRKPEAIKTLTDVAVSMGYKVESPKSKD